MQLATFKKINSLLRVDGTAPPALSDPSYRCPRATRTQRHAVSPRDAPHSISQTLEVWEFVHVLSPTARAVDPADGAMSAMGIFAGNERPILEAEVHHAVEPVRLVPGVSVDRLGQRLDGIILEDGAPALPSARRRPSARTAIDRLRCVRARPQDQELPGFASEISRIATPGLEVEIGHPPGPSRW